VREEYPKCNCVGENVPFSLIHPGGMITRIVSDEVRSRWNRSDGSTNVTPGDADGYDPTAAVIFDAEGNVYSTTAVGGPFNGGVVFKLARSSDGTWLETVLHAFDNGARGGGLAGGVTFGPDGNLYGGAAVGGIGGGIIYKLTPTATGWEESVLHTFSGFKRGSFPRSPLLIDPDGHISVPRCMALATTVSCSKSNNKLSEEFG
jgi:hypothetical protein